MTSPTNPLLPLDVLLPALIPRAPVRFRVLLRRANEQYQVIDDKIQELVPRDTKGNITAWLGKHEALVHEAKFRMGLNLWDLEDHIRAYPDSSIKGEVEMLRMQFSFLHHILGDFPPYNGPCTDRD
ncbi:hypothetical protein N0V95_005919 [Ascochyta clinopodiicola]|nr:hypothetical protein N0V95_005919 [Ascochyta clinopodiicola]